MRASQHFLLEHNTNSMFVHLKQITLRAIVRDRWPPILAKEYAARYVIIVLWRHL